MAPAAAWPLDSTKAALATWATDFNTDPSCDWTTDLDMALGSSSVWSTSKLQVAVLVTQIRMVLAATRPLDTNKAADFRPDPMFHMAFGGNMGHG